MRTLGHIGEDRFNSTRTDRAHKTQSQAFRVNRSERPPNVPEFDRSTHMFVQIVNERFME